MVSKKLVPIIILTVSVLVSACISDSGKSYESGETHTLTTTATTPTKAVLQIEFDLDEMHVKFDGLVEEYEKFNPIEDGDDTDFVDLYQIYSYRNS